MSQRKKSQPSIKKFFGWSTTSQVSSPNKEEHNFDLNEDLDILGYNEECVEEFQGEEPSTQRKRKLKEK
jgi:hypothetical protein